MAALREDERASTWWLWALSPVIALAAAWLSTYAIDAVLRIGPLDRAWLGWGITIPLVLISPWLAAQAAHRAGDESLAWLAVLAPAVLAGAAVTLLLALSTTQVLCTAVTNPLQAVPRALIVGVATGLAFAIAAGFTLLLPRDRPVVALLVSGVTGIGGVFAVALALVYAFPPLSCAYVPV
jgi:hypothetical protein